jgi:transposase
MAGARRGGRQPGKSDPIDAEAVALAALRHDDLPVAELDGPTREVKLLVDYRRDLVTQRTRVQNQLRWHLHELDPELHMPPAGCAATASSTTCSTGSPNAPAWSPG